MSYTEIVKKFLVKVKEIFDEHPTRREPGDGSDGTCDCIGLIIGAIRRMGLKWTGIHGSNWCARKEMATLEKIRSADDLQIGDIVLKGRDKGMGGWNLPSRYQNGGRYYTGDLTDYYHAGVVYSVNPLQIRHMSSQMTIDTRLNQNRRSVWNYHGKCRILVKAAGGDTGAETGAAADPLIPSSGSMAVVVAESGSTVNLRNTPRKSGALIERVPIWTTVEILEPGENWARIRAGKREGYMMAKFLDIIGDGKGKY